MIARVCSLIKPHRRSAKIEYIRTEFRCVAACTVVEQQQEDSQRQGLGMRCYHLEQSLQSFVSFILSSAWVNVM
jgi:hypothetical protein